MEASLAVQDYMKLIAGLQEGRKKLTFSSIEAFVLEYGKEWPTRPRPLDVEKGTEKLCFKNAFDLCLKRGWTYVEGFALSMIPTMHAWAVDADGFVVDPTWTDGQYYFGVSFPMPYVMRTIFKREAYGVLCAMELGYPLLTGEHDYDAICEGQKNELFFRAACYLLDKESYL